MRIVAGLYDGSMHGWAGEVSLTPDASAVSDVDAEEPEEDLLNRQKLRRDVAFGDASSGDLALAFAYAAHTSCVRCLAVMPTKGGQIMASGGSDDLIHVYNLEKQREIGELSMHDDSVLCLEFVRGSHLLSGGNDGKICVWRTRDWQCIHVLKGHKDGPVTSIAARSCGRVALSTSRDNSLRMWDLLTGRPATRNKFDDYRELGHVCWSPDGDSYACVADNKDVLIFSVGDTSGKPSATIRHPSRVNALTFMHDALVATGSDDGTVRVFALDGSEVRVMQCREADAAAASAHGNSDASADALDEGPRVRALSLVARPVSESQDDDDDEDADLPLLVVGLSTGRILMVDIVAPTNDPVCVLRARSSAHLTCVATDFIPPTLLAGVDQQAEDEVNAGDKQLESVAEETEEGEEGEPRRSSNDKAGKVHKKTKNSKKRPKKVPKEVAVKETFAERSEKAKKRKTAPANAKDEEDAEPQKYYRPKAKQAERKASKKKAGGSGSAKGKQQNKRRGKK